MNTSQVNARVSAATDFEAFFVDRYPALVRIALWMGIDATTAEDLAQEALRRTHRRWSDVAIYDHPKSFVRRVLVNLVLNERERRQREPHVLSRLDAAHGVDRRGSLDGSLGGWIDVDDPLWRAVRSLPDQQRAAIALRYLDDLDVGDIAVALDCSPATVRVHLHRAHRRLAELLAPTARSEEAR